MSYIVSTVASSVILAVMFCYGYNITGMPENLARHHRTMQSCGKALMGVSITAFVYLIIRLVIYIK